MKLELEKDYYIISATKDNPDNPDKLIFIKENKCSYTIKMKENSKKLTVMFDDIYSYNNNNTISLYARGRNRFDITDNEEAARVECAKLFLKKQIQRYTEAMPKKIKYLNDMKLELNELIKRQGSVMDDIDRLSKNIPMWEKELLEYRVELENYEIRV